MGQDLVSVIVPTRNAGLFIGATLKRILEASEPLEVVVVDDGSSDNSLEQVKLIDDRRVRVVHGPCKGIAACLNTGLAHSRGTIIMRCDADDLFPPRRIREQLLWLSAHPDYQAVCGAFSTVDETGALVADLLPGIGNRALDITAEMQEGHLRTSLGTFAIREGLLRRVQGFRDYFESAEDLDFQFRLAEHGRIHYLPITWYLWRLHRSSVTHSQAAVRREFFEQVARELQRQRRLRDGADDLQLGVPPIPPLADSTQSGTLSAASHVQGMLLGRAWLEHAAGRKAAALATGLRAIRSDPYRLNVWKSVAALAIKRAGGGTP